MDHLGNSVFRVATTEKEVVLKMLKALECVDAPQIIFPFIN